MRCIALDSEGKSMQSEEQPQFCTHCGGKFVPSDKFCQMCGTTRISKKTGIIEMIFNSVTDLLAKRWSDPWVRIGLVAMVVWVVLFWLLLAIG